MRLPLPFLLSAAIAMALHASPLDSADTRPSRTIDDPGPMVTDRPDYTEGTETVAPGWVQIEGGLVRSLHRQSDGTTLSQGGPFPLIRTGLIPWMELRIGSDGYYTESRNHNTAAGMADLQIGMKIRLLRESRWRPGFSAVASIFLPTGAAAFTGGGRDPQVELCFSKNLPAGFDAGAMFTSRWDTAAPSIVRERGYSLTVGHALPGRIAGFMETYRLSPIAGDERAHLIVDAGVARMLARNVQVDISVGHTLGAHTPCWFVGAGIATRFPLPRLR